MCHYVIISILFKFFKCLLCHCVIASNSFVGLMVFFFVFLSLRHYRIFFVFWSYVFLSLCFTCHYKHFFCLSLFFVSSMSLYAFFFVGQGVKSWCKH
jgi:hypothetical protein